MYFKLLIVYIYIYIIKVFLIYVQADFMYFFTLC